MNTIIKTLAVAAIGLAVAAPAVADTVGVFDHGAVRMTLTNEPCKVLGSPAPSGYKLILESRESRGKINGCWTRYDDSTVTYYLRNPAPGRYQPTWERGQKLRADLVNWTETGATLRTEYPNKLEGD
jgi:hypothetical protein